MQRAQSSSTIDETSKRSQPKKKKGVPLDDGTHIEGFVPNRTQTWLVRIAILLTLGLFKLVLYWLPALEVRLTHKPTDDLKNAKVVLQTEAETVYKHRVYPMRIKKDNRPRPLFATDAVSADQSQSAIISFATEATPDPTPEINTRAKKGCLSKYPCCFRLCMRLRGWFPFPNLSLQSFLDWFMVREQPDFPEMTLSAFNSKANFTLLRYFEHKKLKYVWNEETNIYIRIKGYDEDPTILHQFTCPDTLELSSSSSPALELAPTSVPSSTLEPGHLINQQLSSGSFGSESSSRPLLQSPASITSTCSDNSGGRASNDTQIQAPLLSEDEKGALFAKTHAPEIGQHQEKAIPEIRVAVAIDSICDSKSNANGVVVSGAFFHKCATQALPASVREALLAYFGENSLSVALTPLLSLVVREILSPFYIFQLFSVTLWLCDNYYYYAGAIILMSILSLTFATYETRQMQKSLRRMVDSDVPIDILNPDGKFSPVGSSRLVPGDVISLPRQGGFQMPCDAVLLTGECLLDEAMLTGESAPAKKTGIPNSSNEADPLPESRARAPGKGSKRSSEAPSKAADPAGEESFSVRTHGRHVLFAGTRVLQTRYFGDKNVLAVVIRTGFLTSKGELLRSIMYPKPLDFKFARQSFQFLMALGILAILGFIYTIFLMLVVWRSDEWTLIVRRSLDVFTIVIPPALPAAMTVGIVFAQQRLKRARIFCIAPNAINQAGTIDVVAFDKTGTLTEEGLDMQGIVPVLPFESQAAFDQMVGAESLVTRLLYPSFYAQYPPHARTRHQSTGIIGGGGLLPDEHLLEPILEEARSPEDDDEEEEVDEGVAPPPPKSARRALFECLACCHSLTKLDGKLIGDPLDDKMFAALKCCELEEQGEETSRFGQLAPTVVKVKPPSPPNPPANPIGSKDNIIIRRRSRTASTGSNKSLSEAGLGIGLGGNNSNLSSILGSSLIGPTSALTQPSYPLLPRLPSFEIGIVRQLTFVPSLQRMSVIVQVAQSAPDPGVAPEASDTKEQVVNPGESYAPLPRKTSTSEKETRNVEWSEPSDFSKDDMENCSFELYSKGAPEMIASLCLPNSVPPDFRSVLDGYTRRGLRVLALAWRRFPNTMTFHRLEKAPRATLERDMHLIGLLVMENRLKRETTSVIDELHNARIRCLMVTGDNILTALSVSRQCHMIQTSERVLIVNATLQSSTNASINASNSMGSADSGLKDEQYLPLFRTANLNLRVSFKSEEGFPIEPLLDARWKPRKKALSKRARRTVLIQQASQSAPQSQVAVHSQTSYANERLLAYPSNPGPPPSGDLSNPSFAKTQIDLNAVLDEIDPALMDQQPLHFAMAGDSWQTLYDNDRELLLKLVRSGTIFARMLPDQKQQLIECLQDLDKQVCMCGDGCNDCGALRAAQTGISLSEAEASVAANFTSQVANITCVPTVIREGRAALVTSFGIFRYMAAYSLTQFASILLLYWFMSNLTDFQFLFIDLVLITTICVTFGRTEAYKELSSRKPRATLVDVIPIGGMLLHLLIIVIAQIVACIFTRIQPWFEEKTGSMQGVEDEKEHIQCYENTAIFTVSMFQYLATAYVFSQGPPFRDTVLSNRWFLLNLILSVVVCLLIALVPDEYYFALLNPRTILEMYPMPVLFSLILVFIAMLNFFVSHFLETYVLEMPWADWTVGLAIRFLSVCLLFTTRSCSRVSQRSRSRSNRSNSRGSSSSATQHRSREYDSRAIRLRPLNHLNPLNQVTSMPPTSASPITSS